MANMLPFMKQSEQTGIGSTDKAAINDSFGIENYINGLAQYIQQCNMPMTIAIQGDWGTGKTSVMQMVCKKIRENNKNLIWFNTWQYSQFNLGDQLPALMLGKFITSLGGRDHDADDKLKKKVAGIFNVISGIATKGATDGSKFTDAILQDSFSDNLEGLSEEFNDLVDARLKNSPNDRVIIFVDDLDRLAPGRAVELLEVMKNFFDCEKCVFVLAIDYGVVIRGVRDKYGEDFDSDKGKSFFDKIIQVPFKMPLADYKIEDYVDENLKKSNILVDNAKLTSYVSLIEGSVGRNPRAMKRLFNAFSLLKFVSADIFMYQDKMLMLFALLCLQTSYEEIYNYLVNIEPQKLTGEKILELADDNSGVIESIYKKPVQDEKNGVIDKDKVIAAYNFGELLVEVIDNDGTEGLSVDELERFKEVIKCSAITAKDQGVSQIKKHKNDTIDFEDLIWDHKKSDEEKQLIKKLMCSIDPTNTQVEITYVNNGGNNPKGHIVARTIETGTRFCDVYCKATGFSFYIYAPSKEAFSDPKLSELEAKKKKNHENKLIRPTFDVRSKEDYDYALEILRYILTLHVGDVG